MQQGSDHDGAVEAESAVSPRGRGRDEFRRAMVYLALGILAFSSIPIFLKHFSASLDAWTVNGFRYSVGGVTYRLLLCSSDSSTRRRGAAERASIPAKAAP